MARLAWICLGGAAGTAARYLLGLYLARRLGAAFPYGTLAVNVLGSFLMAAVVQAARTPPGAAPATWVVATTTGVLGGFTTYSAFNTETLAYFDRGQWGSGALYVSVMLAACLLAGLAGATAARALS